MDTERDLQERLKDLEGRRDELKASVESIGSEEHPSSIEDRIDQAEQRIEIGRNIISALERAEEAISARKELNEELNRIERRVRATEQLVKAFSPEGIKARLIDETLSRIQEETNQNLSSYTGGEYRVRFTSDDDSFLQCKKRGWEDWVPPEFLSRSERLRIGIALQDTLNQLTALKFLLIDEVSMLDPDNRGTLVNAIIDLRERYDRCLCSLPSVIQNPRIRAFQGPGSGV